MISFTPLSQKQTETRICQQLRFRCPYFIFYASIYLWFTYPVYIPGNALLCVWEINSFCVLCECQVRLVPEELFKISDLNTKVQKSVQYQILSQTLTELQGICLDNLIFRFEWTPELFSKIETQILARPFWKNKSCVYLWSIAWKGWRIKLISK